MARIVGSLHPIQIAQQVRANHDMPETRLLYIRINTCKRAIKPLADPAEHRVVMRAFPIPVFPQSGCTLRDLPAKARLRPLVHQRVSHVASTARSEQVESDSRSEDSRIEVAVVVVGYDLH